MTDKVKKAALYKSIPNNYVDVAVGVAAGKVDLSDLSGVDVTGQYIRLKAQTGDITFLRGDHTGTLTAGDAVVLSEGEAEEFYVDPKGDTELTHISDGASKKLRVLYDDETT